MIVLHILWMILKILGIVLLVLLGILLAVILAVLFCPVVYRAEGKKDADTLSGRAGASWLFHLVSVQVWYENRKTDYSVRICGISPEKVMDFFENMKKRKSHSSEKSVETKEAPALVSKIEKTGEKMTEDVEGESLNDRTKPPKKVYKRLTAAVGRVIGIPQKLVNALKNFWLTGKDICGKIEKIREFLESDSFIRGKELVTGELKKLSSHSKPKRLGGTVKFGTEDPYITGEFLAAAGIFYPLYGEYFIIEPCFDRKILEGNIFMRGRIRGIFLLIPAWKLFWDSDIRYIVKKFKQL